MSASITGFGSAFLFLAMYCVLFRRKWLIFIVGVAVVLQAPSVLSIGSTLGRVGLSAFAVCAALIAAHGIVAFAPRRRMLADTLVRDKSIRLWAAFMVVATLTALLGPGMFREAAVFLPLDKAGVDGIPRSLGWTVNHLAQVFNVLLTASIFVWVLGYRHELDAPRGLVSAIALATILAVVVGLQQRLAWNGLVPLWAEFWASNPTYAQDYQGMAGPVPRVSWPFVDPSYASAFFAAVFGGFLAMFLAGQRTNAALLGVIVSLFALGNTLGATGSLAVMIIVLLAAVVLMVVAVRRPALAGALAYRILLLSLAAGCVALGGFLVLRHYDLLGVFGEAMRNVLAGRSQTFLGDIRPHADLMSLKLLVETWGLGVGMGSHRGSSYLITLAANTGVLGLVTFLAANVMHFTLLTKRFIRHPDAPSAFFLGSGISVLIAVSIAIPDQNWPVYWILILGGFACIICPVEGEKADGPSGGDTAETPDQLASRAG